MVFGGVVASEAAEQLSGRAEPPPSHQKVVENTCRKNMKSHRGFHKFIDAFLQIQYNFTITYQVRDLIFFKKSDSKYKMP